jgi:tetratricopeptide (TPR) repeat protein
MPRLLALLLGSGRCLALVAALLAGVAPAARADGPDDADTTVVARKHYERAEKLFALGRFEAALTEYEAAFEARPLPGFLFNIGQCHRNLGNYDAAIFSFRKYLRLSPNADNRDDVDILIADLEQKKHRAEAEAAARRDAEAAAARQPAPLKKRAGKPIYTRWWFWTGVAAVGAGAGAGAYFLTRDDGLPSTTLPPVEFP